MASELEFRKMDADERRAFLKENWGFLQSVRDDLAERGVSISSSSLTRTWYGDFTNPNRRVIMALNRAYRAKLKAAA